MLSRRLTSRLISLLVVLIVAFSLVSGCSNTSGPEATDIPAPIASGASQTSGDQTAATSDSEDSIDWTKYPIVTDGSVTLTAWWPTSNTYITDPNETLPFIEGSKRTGIKWEFLVPSSGSEGEQFNLMIVSDEWPDLIKGFASYYSRGLDNAIDEEIILPLEDYLYAMPAIDYWRNSSDLIKKSLTTDGGHFAGIPLILIGSQDHKAQGAYSGYGVRSDWLNNLGLKVPETYDELDAVLKAFQDAGYCEHPLELWPNADTYAIMAGHNIVSVMPFYGQIGGWLVDGNKVKYALFEDNYKAYIKMLNEWCQKGYFENDYYTVNTFWNNALTKASNNELGVFNFMYTWYGLFKSTALDSTFDIEAMPVLRLNKTDKVHVRSESSGASIYACVTTQSTQPEMVCSYWNYFFTDEGILLGNYGVEGETFEYVNGEPKWMGRYDELVAEHDSSYAQGMLFIYLTPGFRWWDRELQAVGEKEKSFLKIWDSDAFTDSEYFYPSGATMTAEESQTYNDIMSDIGTLISENITQFIVGLRSMDEWDSFCEQIRSMGIEQAQACKQSAFDRYQAR